MLRKMTSMSNKFEKGLLNKTILNKALLFLTISPLLLSLIASIYYITALRLNWIEFTLETMFKAILYIISGPTLALFFEFIRNKFQFREEMREDIRIELKKTEGEIIPLIEKINDKYILLRDMETSLSDQILRDEYSRAVRFFSTRISDLGTGYFNLELEDIPKLSLEIIEQLKTEAFATVVVGDTDQFFYTDAGKNYLTKCYEAANRMSGKFTRLFIISDFVSVTPRLYEIMERHVKEGINVLVITRDELIANHIESRNDFAIWDRHYFMQIMAQPEAHKALLNVQVGGPKIEKALKDSIKMSQLAKSWNEFNEEFCKPMNGKEWFDLLPKFRSFSAPAGPSNNDIQNMWDGAIYNNNFVNSVLAFGYTEEIINFLVKQTSKRVDVLDIGVFHPQRASNISYYQGNWLNWKQPQSLLYDIVIGDDILANIAIWQFHIFFRNVSTLLNPSGILVIRTVGDFSKSPTDNPGFQTTLDELKKLAPVKEELLIAKLWPMFHSPEFYDERTKSFDLRDWNKKLEHAKYIGLVTSEEFAALRLNYPLKQTSLPFNDILQYAANWFDLVEEAPVDKSYTDLSSGFANFYKILWFKKKGT